MFILPLSHESGEVQRWPYVTLGILALNVFLFLVTLIAAPQSREELNREAEDFFEYYMRHPYLDISEETLDKIPPEGRQALDQVRQMEEMVGLGGLRLTPDHLSEEAVQEQQRELDRRVAEFEAALDDEFYRKYGYIPARGRLFNMVSSMFLHGGLLHLLFNMLFLWLCGGNIEDLWGRVVFPIFYLTGGVAATLMHAMMFPESHVPLVGASGAIAALMGAFMVRLYNTRIYFWYFIFLGFRLKQGTFKAPAYMMLPLWLLQQLWEAYKASAVATGGGGVAFWAHIGGFLFGAAVAFAFRATRFEENVLAPALDRKTDLVDPHYASGNRKLREGDLDGAVMDLRKALLTNPDHALAHGDLSRAYFQQGKERAGMLELGRAVRLHLSRNDTESAIEEYIDSASRFSGPVLEPDQQEEMARLLGRSEMMDEAADAYGRLIRDLRNRREKTVTPAEQEQLAEALKQAEKERRSVEAQVKTGRSKGKAETPAPAEPAGPREPAAPPVTPDPAPAIPLSKRLKRVPAPGKSPRYKVLSVAPYEAMKVGLVADGIHFHRLGEEPVRFRDIYAICASQLSSVGTGRIYADFFVALKPRPYRIHSGQIAYADFLPKPTASSVQNFRKFILSVASRIDSLYVDEGTYGFLKTGKPKIYSTQDDLEIEERRVWGRIMGEVRSRCDRCYQVYWLDGRKVPPAGARSKCKKCGHSLLIRPLSAAS